MSVTDDLSRLRHMRDAARKITVFIEGESRQSLASDEKLQLSLVRLIEIIGEAAARVSNDLKEKHPQVPWQVIVNMRNRLAHAYFDIDLDVVWDQSHYLYRHCWSKLNRF
jgi:uncharacterized protein with HEPN domain